MEPTIKKFVTRRGGSTIVGNDSGTSPVANNNINDPRRPGIVVNGQFYSRAQVAAAAGCSEVELIQAIAMAHLRKARELEASKLDNARRTLAVTDQLDAAPAPAGILLNASDRQNIIDDRIALETFELRRQAIETIVEADPRIVKAPKIMLEGAD